MKYQLRMIVETGGELPQRFFALEDWMLSLPMEKGELIDFGMAETKQSRLDKDGSWERKLEIVNA